MRIVNVMWALSVAALWGSGGIRVQAADFTVTKVEDTRDGVCDGDCSLREAIIAANALVGADIVILPEGRYQLTILGVDEAASAAGDLDITDDLTINGACAYTSIIDGGGIDRVLDIENVTRAITVTVSDVTITGGHSTDQSSGGGGIRMMNGPGTLIMNRCTVSDNTATGYGWGGGILNVGYLTLNSCTVSENTSDFSGGGICAYQGTVTLNNCTVSGNTAPYGAAIDGANHGPVVTLNNCTVKGNKGGYALRSYLSGRLVLKNTILDNVRNIDFPNVESRGYNICFGQACGLNGAHDRNDLDPVLDPLLAGNGGPTKTHALLDGSPAIDTGNPDDCPATDQRGAPRPHGTACDVGAYEYGSTSGFTSCSCTPPPADMVLWLPFDEGTPGPSENLMGLNDGTQNGSLLTIAGRVDGALEFDGAASYVEVDTYPELNLGTGDFSIDAWVYRLLGDNGVRDIVDKRSDADGYVGFEFYLYDGRPGCQLADGTYTSWYTLPAEVVPSTGWHLVAVTVARSGVGQFYLDGLPFGSPFNPAARSGSLSSDAPLRVGENSFGGAVFHGGIDEVEVYRRALTAPEVRSIFDARSLGKCKTDFDADGVLDGVDNCPTTPNPLQEDINGNGIGDLCEAGYTPVGIPVTVAVAPDLQVTFTEVTAPGFTTVTSTTGGQPPPDGYKIIPSSPPIYYDIFTTATYTPPVTVCFTYDPAAVSGPESNLRVFHDNNDGPPPWDDVTVLPVDETNNIICATVTTLSPFVLAEPCACDCHADPQCDGSPDVLDVVQTINVAFRGFPAIIDPNAACPYQTTDVDANQATDVIDVTKVINVAFRGMTVASQYVDPCAP